MQFSSPIYFFCLDDTVSEVCLFLDFSLTVKAAPHECVIRTGQP